MQASNAHLYYPLPIANHEVIVPKPVMLEELLELILFLFLGIYMVSHMLFIPLEILAFGFLLDLHFSSLLYFFAGIIAAKYITIFIMLYGAFHHTNLWYQHHYSILGFFAIACLLVSGVLSFFIYSIDQGFRSI